ncbi:MAG: hypothetical protein ACYC8T_18715 [Myxococcaceae bacterium]
MTGPPVPGRMQRPFQPGVNLSATSKRDLAIWGFAFGYFASYAPYSALTKALTDGALPGAVGRVSGFQILPATTIASLLGMFAFLTAMRWWKHATHSTVFGFSLPRPTKWTLLSGLCTAAVIGTTTLAYTFKGASIVFMMLLMRGGVLILAPIVDAASKRPVRLFSWIGLALSMGAVVVATLKNEPLGLTVVAGIDVAIYLASYFIRLRFMSHIAKSNDPAASTRYFVEEQMVATPAIVLTLIACALIGEGQMMQDIRQGFVGFRTSGVMVELIVIGVLSQGTGIFGGLILLDRRENSFCVPVNRASSILAGVVASYALSVLLGMKPVGSRDLIGALLVIGAIVALTLPGVLKARAARAAPGISGAGGPAPG